MVHEQGHPRWNQVKVDNLKWPGLLYHGGPRETNDGPYDREKSGIWLTGAILVQDELGKRTRRRYGWEWRRGIKVCYAAFVIRHG